MVNIDELNRIADIPKLYNAFMVGVQLKQNGNELCGPCPWCGGKDRFYIKVESNPQRCGCRQCTDGTMKALDFYARLNNLPTTGAELKRTAEDFANYIGAHPEYKAFSSAGSKAINNTVHKPLVFVPYRKPSAEWQELMMPYVDEFADILFSEAGKCALDYLEGRGLDKNLLREKKIGYNPEAVFTNYHITKYTDNGKELKQVVIGKGIIIPAMFEGNLMRVKCRPIVHHEGQPKYYFVRGSIGTSPFICKDYERPFTFITEGEFDDLTVYQCAYDICNAVTFGSANNPGRAGEWGKWYTTLGNIRITFDNDEDELKQAGFRKREKELKAEIMRVKEKTGMPNEPIIYHLPKRYKDWNDVLQKDGEDAVRHYVIEATEAKQDAE